jgi:hypothetical protein
MEHELMPHVGLMHHSSWGKKTKRKKDLSSQEK